MVKPISVYDNRTRKRLAYLENAYDISYDKSTNSIWTAEFSLPFSDPKTRHCQAFNYVELWEENEMGRPQQVGLFRIMPRTEETIGTEANIVYRLEHVLGTLIDDVMIGYHEIGNLGVYTDQVIGYILQNQSDPNWILGECAYKHQFLYGWQDENLLSSLFSVVQPFEETDYYWDFDTTKFPWTLDLKRTNKEPVTDIRYRKNLNGLTRTVDPTNLTTRLYCYGYGQGDNKLGIAELNDGVPYLESPNVSKYGVITQVWTDERFTIAESLKEVGETMLRRLEEPAVSYEMDIQAIYGAANLAIGDTVRVVSSGLDELMTVRQIVKDDVTGAPQAGTILLGDATIDISNSVAELANRQRIAETYSQGAESIFTDSFVDNADPSNPAEIVFTIPDNVVHVNEIRFSCQLAPFRAYSRAIQGGGAESITTLDGGSSEPTSETLAQQNRSTLSNPSRSTSSQSGGGWYDSTRSTSTTYPTSSYDGGMESTVGIYNILPDRNNPSVLHNHGLLHGSKFVERVTAVRSGGVVTGIDVEYVKQDSRYDANWVDSGNHNHYIKLGTHRHEIRLDGHSHSFSVGAHTHDINIPQHTHDFTIPAHSHKVVIKAHNHKISLPNHVHGIEYGIYKGPRATSYKVFLDDKEIGTYTGNINDINLIDYMSKNANGNIMRGKHTIRITPNTLTRVECTFQIRLFTNMHGGRQY